MRFLEKVFTGDVEDRFSEAVHGINFSGGRWT